MHVQHHLLFVLHCTDDLNSDCCWLAAVIFRSGSMCINWRMKYVVKLVYVFEF